MGNSGFLVSDCSPLLCYNHAKTTTFSTQSFTGKERDSETGFSYFGARYYDSDILTNWLSVDPLADKYPNISPYAYCAWNPIKLVDPDGEDVWEVDNYGYVKRINGEGGINRQTVKFSNGTTKKFNGKNYHAIMNDLSNTDEKGVSRTMGNENMQDAMANIFLTMADNTDVEWRMDRYNDNSYALGTWHKTNASPISNSLSGGKFHDIDVISMIHSHPMLSYTDNPKSIKNQKESMGYGINGFITDYSLKQSNFKNTFYYTYFPKTRQLWSVELYKPRFMNTINSYKSLFFGTINTH